MRVSNTASKFRGTSLNDVLLVGRDLLQSLWGDNFQVQRPTDNKMFLHVQVEEEGKKYFSLLSREDDEQLQILQYNKHILEQSHYQGVSIFHPISAPKTSKMIFQKVAD